MNDEPISVPGVPAADTPSANTPAPLSNYDPSFDPFADAKGQEVSQAPTPLLERMRLHFKESQSKGTIFGALNQFGAAAVERGAIARGSASEAENEAIDRAVKTRNDLEAYDRMPGSEGFLDYGAALVGQLAGGITSPESLIGEVAKVPVWLGTSALGRMAWFGANQAAVQTAADPAIQGINIAGGARSEYSAFENFVEKPIGGFVGGALLKGAHEAGTALFVRPQAEKDALTFFRTLRDHGGADEQKRWPEFYEGVQGKSDAELADMAKEIGKDDKAAGDNAKPVEPAEAEKPAEPVEPEKAAEPVEPEPVAPEPAPETAPPIPADQLDHLIGQPAPNMLPHRVATADGKSVDVAPIIMEAGDLKASNDAGYATELQPRSRDRAASQAQITHISTRLDPERLGHSTEASHGAPIVGPDGMVESGNGRIMAIRDAYEQNGDAAQRYRDWLTSQGVDVSQYKNPVLVRQRVTPMTDAERQAFTVSANQSSMLSMSAPERAMADARVIGDSSLDLIQNPNDLGAIANRDFVRMFVSKLPQSEQGAMMNSEGGLSAEGLLRVRNAVLARAYKDINLLIRIAESTDDEVKSISNALVVAAPHWARLVADVEAGRVRADIDLTPELMEAVRRTADIRAKGTKLDSFLAQQDAFDKVPEAVEDFMRMFYNREGRRAASAQKIADGLQYYAEQGAKVMADGGLDLGMTPVTPRDIVRTALERGFKSDREAGLFERGGAGDGARTEATGGEVSGQRPGGERTGAGEAGAGSDQGRPVGTGPEGGTGEAVRPTDLPADVPNEVFRGSGREDKGSAYNQSGGANDAPILGKAAYFAFDRDTASQFGPNVETAHIGDVASKPLVITDGAQWRALTREAGWEFPNPFGSETLAADIARLRKIIEAKGHDGVVVWWDAKSGLDIGHNGENIKLLRDVFGDPQAVSFKARPKAVEPKVKTSEGIGDALAAQHNSPDGTLDIAVRKTMEASLPRPTEAAIARSGLTTNLVEAPNLREAWTSLASAFKAVVRQGRLISKKAAGEFTLKSGVIRMKQLDDLTVFAHELGHHLEYTNPDLATLIRPPPKAKAPNPQLPDKGTELDGMTAYAAGHKDPAVRRSEGFAEFFRLFVEHPAEAQRRAPGFYNEFNKYLDAKPEYKAALLKAQRDFDNYRMANASDLVDANIHTSAVPKGWEKIRNDVRNQGFWNTITDRGSMVYTGLLDEKNPLRLAVQQLLKMQKENNGKIMSLIAADDPYKLMRLAQNAHQAGMVDLMHGVSPYRSNTPEGPSMYDAIALATGKPNVLSGWDEAAVKKFNGYLIARRGVFEWERRMAGLHKQDPMPMAKDMYETKIREYEAANPNARQAAEMVHEYARNLLKKEYDAGLISSESYDLAMQIRDYVPLMRDMSDKSTTGEGSFDAANVGLKQFRGSSRPIIDPIESLISRSFRTAQLIAHNDGIKALATLADKAGVGAGALVERVSATEIKARYVDPLEAIRKGLAEAGVSEADAKLALTEMLDNLMVDEQSIGPVSIFRSQQAAARGENLIFYLSGGEMKALRLKEGDFGRDLINNLTSGMSTPLRDWNLQGLAKVSQVLRGGVVTSPDFFITNMIRDQMATWILNRGTFPLLDSIRGVFHEVTNNELARTMSQMGGIAGGANLNAIDHARMDKDIQALAAKGFTVARVASFEGYFKMIELSETASRVGLFGVAYKRALKQGLSPYEASVEAAFTANDNLDFGRHGSKIGDTIKIVPFMNAQLQGLDKAFRTLVSPLFKEKLTTQDVEAQKTMLSAYTKIAALTGLSMALRAAYIDDPEYSEMSDYMRNTHWMVRVPGIKGNKIIDMFGKTVDVPPGLQNLWLAIPKPFELAILPNLGERAVEMLANKDPTALARWAWGAKDLVASKWMMDSVGVKIPFEISTGKDTFTGRDIVPEHVAGREPWMQATAGTSAIAKAIGKAADKAERALGMEGGGLSPMYIDHIVKGVGGSWGRSFLAMSDAAMGDKGDQSLANTAITRRVFKEAYNGSTSSDTFWKTVGKTNGAYSQAANTYDALASNPADQASYVARLPEDKRAWVIMDKSDFPADEKALHPLHRAHDAITAISNMQREIADKNLSEAASLETIQLSSSEQRVALDGLNRIRMFEARNALIVAGHPALKGQKLGNVDAEMEMLKDTVPNVYNELAQRYANAKVYKASSVAEHWDEVKRAVIDDGSSAHLRGIASEVRRDGYELDERASKKKKVRPVIPGALDDGS